MAAQFARAPHQGRNVAPVQGAPNAALLIDFDNVTMGIRSDLSKELKTLLNSDIIKGKVAVQRAYADWRRYPQYIVPLAEASVDLIFAPAYGSSKKNATDIRLAIDALELIFTRPEIGTFILLSGDSDFSSLVLKLKEYGKYVIGVGIRESTSDLLVQNCDEYYSYSALTGLTRAGEEGALPEEDPWVLVERAVRLMAEQNDVMRSDRLKQVMLEIDPNFSEKELGFPKFNRFLQEAAAKGVISLTRLENGQFEVGPPEAKRLAREGRRPREEARRAEAEEVVEPRRAVAPAPEARRAPVAEPRREVPAEPRREPRREVPAEPAAPVQPVAERPAAERAPGREPREREPELREAYALLRRAVSELVSSDGDKVRDSDVKRRILEIQPDWNESEYGFSKFSRFLRQAHDAEVINLHKVENGSYDVSPGEAQVADIVPAAREEREPRRGRERRERRAEPVEKVAAEAAPVAEPAPAPPAGKKPEPEKPVEAAAEPAPAVETAPAAAVPEQPAEAAAERAAEPAAEAQPAPAPTRRVGFIRRGSRGRAPVAPPPLLPGQVAGRAAATKPAGEGLVTAQVIAAPEPPAPAIEEPAAVAEPAVAAEPATVAEAPVAAEEKKAEGGRRTRKRGGRSRRKGAAAATAAAEPQEATAEVEPAAAEVAEPEPQPAAAGAAEPAPEPAAATALWVPTEAAAVVEYMTHRYKGVGKKTAETLIDAFGAERVFDALTREPERVRELLGARRAEAVLAAWEADRAQRQPEATPEPAAPAAEAESAGPAVVSEAPEAKKKPTRRGHRGGSRRGGRSRKPASSRAE